MTALTLTGPACFVADLGSQNPLDLNKLKAARWNGVACEGVILRATRSNGLADEAFASRSARAAALDFLVGAYAFNTGETAQVQAGRFLQVTRPLGAMLRALDFESNPSGGQMSLAAAIEFLDRVDQATGRLTWLYSGDRIKSLITAATDAQFDFLSHHALWGCEYGPEFKMMDANGKRLPWLVPTLWQFTGDGVGPEPQTLDGLETGADLSVFRGSRSNLEALWAGIAVSVAAPASIEVPKPAATKPVTLDAAMTAKAAPRRLPQSPPPAAPRPFDWFFNLFGK